MTDEHTLESIKRLAKCKTFFRETESAMYGVNVNMTFIDLRQFGFKRFSDWEQNEEAQHARGKVIRTYSKQGWMDPANSRIAFVQDVTTWVGVYRYIKEPSDEPISVVAYSGEYIVRDGTHRCIAALMRDEMVLVNVVVPIYAGGR